VGGLELNLSELEPSASALSLSLPTKRIELTKRELTSQNLWSRYDRHFVGITWHFAWS